MALGSLVVATLAIFGQFSFDVVLIQNQKSDRQHYDTVWTLTIIRQILIALLLVLTAKQIAQYFGEPRLEIVIYFLCVCAIAEGFVNVAVVDFRKHLNFHKEFLLLIIPKLGAFVVGISLAFILRDYRALVGGVLTNSLVLLALSYIMHPYRPRLCLERWREVMNFSKYLLVNNITALCLYQI